MRQEVAALCRSDMIAKRSCCHSMRADVKQQFLLNWMIYKKSAKMVQRNFSVDKNILVSLQLDFWTLVTLTFVTSI